MSRWSIHRASGSSPLARARADPEATDGATDTDTGTTTEDAHAVATAGGRQQVDFAIHATATDMAQASAFLDALRAGPRLLNGIIATATQAGGGAISVQIDALTYIDAEG